MSVSFMFSPALPMAKIKSGSSCKLNSSFICSLLNAPMHRPFSFSSAALSSMLCIEIPRSMSTHLFSGIVVQIIMKASGSVPSSGKFSSGSAAPIFIFASTFLESSCVTSLNLSTCWFFAEGIRLLILTILLSSSILTMCVLL